MALPDLVVRSKRVVVQGGVRPAAIHVRDGRIVGVGAYDDVAPGCPLDAAGDAVVIPGVVDTHVHVNEPGRTEGVAVALPEGISVQARPDATLNDMLIAGEIDALIAPHPPLGFEDGSGAIVRLFSDHRAVEEAYFTKSGVFPIMHIVALRADAHERHPWVAMNLLSAFSEAKRRSLQRALDVNAPRLPVPWAAANARRAQELMGEDVWPYGIEPNRATLEAFLHFAYEQGVCARQLTAEELFVAQVRQAFRV